MRKVRGKFVSRGKKKGEDYLIVEAIGVKRSQIQILTNFNVNDVSSKGSKMTPPSPPPLLWTIRETKRTKIQSWRTNTKDIDNISVQRSLGGFRRQCNNNCDTMLRELKLSWSPVRTVSYSCDTRYEIWIWKNVCARRVRRRSTKMEGNMEGEEEIVRERYIYIYRLMKVKETKNLPHY